MKTVSANTNDLRWHIEWLDAINATIIKIEDDRGGSGAWVIYFTKDTDEIGF